MAIKISQLPSAGALTGAELVPIVQSGVTVQTPVSAIPVSATSSPYTPPGTGAVPTTVAKQFFYWTPQDFGAVGDGVTDDTAAWQLLGAAIQANGGGYVFSPPGKNYAIYQGTGTWVAGASYFLSFNGITGLYIDMNGSKFTIAGNFATNSATLYLCSFVGCFNVFMKDWAFTQTVSHTGSSQYGTWGLSMTNSPCTDFVFVNPKAIGGQGMLFCQGNATDPPYTGSRRITGIGGYASNCEYGINFANSGDDIVWKGLETNTVGRSYFAYGCVNHDISLTSTNAIINDILISPGGQTGSTRPTRNIRLNYKTYPRTDSSTSPGYIYVGQGTGASNTGWILGDIDIHVDMDLSADVSPGSAIIFGKGHTSNASSIWENIRIGGVIKGIPNSVYNVLNLFQSADAPWSGEQMLGLDLNNLALEGSGSNSIVYIDAQPTSNSTTSISLRNILAPYTNLTIANTSSNVAGSNAYFYNTQWIDRQVTNGMAWTAASSNPAIGNGSFLSLWARSGKVLNANGTLTAGTTTTFGTGAFRFNAISSPPDVFAITGGITCYGIAYGAHGGSKNVGIVTWSAGNSYFTIIDSTTGSSWDATHPWTWASADTIDFNISLIIAA